MADPKPPRATKPNKTGRRFLAVLIFFILAPTLAGVAIALFKTGTANQSIVAAILAQARKRLNGQVKIGALEGDPFSAFAVTGLTVHDQNGELMLEVDRLDVTWRLSGGVPRATAVANHVIFTAIKSNSNWNWKAIKKNQKRPTKKSLPIAFADVTVKDLDLTLSWREDRVIKVQVPEVVAKLDTGGPNINFEITKLSGLIADADIKVESLLAKGAEVSVDGGWETRLQPVVLKAGETEGEISELFYSTATKELRLYYQDLTLSPAALGLIWPTHPFKVPITAKDSLMTGTMDELNFSANVFSADGDFQADGLVEGRGAHWRAAGHLERLAAAKIFKSQSPLSGLFGNFVVDYWRPVLPPGKLETGKPGAARPVIGPSMLDLELKLDRFDYAGYESFPADVIWKMRDKAYTVTVKSTAPGTVMTVELAGTTDPNRKLEIKAALGSLNLQRLRSSWPETMLAGKVELAGAGADFASFQGMVILALEPSKAFEIELTDATAEFAIANSRITFTQASVRALGANVDFTGWVEPTGPEKAFELELDARVDDQAPLLDDLIKNQVDMRGLSGKVALKGDRSRWSVVGDLSGQDLETPYLKAASVAANLDVAYADQKFSGPIKLTATGAELPGGASSRLKLPAFGFTASIDLEPSELTAPRFRFQLETDRAADFGLAADGEFEMTAGTKDWRVVASRLELSVSGEDFAIARPATLESLGGTVAVRDLEAVSAEASIAADGAFTGSAVDLKLNLQHIDLARWVPKLIDGDTAHGILSLEATFTGSPAAPVAQGKLRLETAGYQFFEVTQAEADLELGPDGLKFDLTADALKFGPLTANGLLPCHLAFAPAAAELNRDAPLTIAIAAPNINAEVIQFFIPWADDPVGRLIMNLEIKGTINNPTWQGAIDFEGLGFHAPPWGLTIENLNGRAEIDQNLITVPAVVARSGEGTATLKGTIRMERFTVAEFGLTIEARDFQAMNQPELRATLDADLALTGNLAAPVFAGDVTFKRLFYRPPLLLEYQGMFWETKDPTITVLGEQAPPAPPEIKSSFYDRARLVLAVVIPPGAGTLANQELTANFEGKLKVEKPPLYTHLISGLLESDQGWFSFQGRAFRIEKAQFDFTAIPTIDPQLDIVANRRVGEYLTTLKIGGKVSAPTLTISSEPPLEEADVLAVILFGRPVSQLAEGERMALIRAAQAILSGYAATSLATSIQDALGIDAIYIDPGDTPEESGLGFGKYLTDKLYLYYYHRFDEAAQDEYRLRFDLNKDLAVEVSRDQKGQSGIDGYYRQSFGDDKAEEAEFEDQTVLQKPPTQ